MADFTRSPEWGTNDGASFDDSAHWTPALGPVVKVILRASDRDITGLGLIYQSGVRLYHGSLSAGTEHVLDLQPGEDVVSLKGRSRDNFNTLELFTSRGRVFGPFGGSSGAKFAFSQSGQCLRYLFGRSSDRIDRLGVTFGTPTPALTATAERSPIHGGNGGTPFDDMDGNPGLSRIIAVKIRHTQYIHGIGMVYEDGRPEQWRGGHYGDLSIFQIPPGEDLVAVDGASGSGVDRLRFYTTNTASKVYGGPGGVAWKEERPGKIIIGMTGRSGSDLDSVGFIFLDRSRVPVRAELIRVEFMTASTQVSEPEFCGSFTAQNSNTTALNLISSYEYQLQEQRKISIADQIGAEVTLSTEMSFGGESSPVSAKVGLSVTSSFSTCRTTERTETTVRTVAGQVNVEVPAKSKITTRWLVRRGFFDVPFTGIMELTYLDGTKEQKPTSGTFSGVNATDFMAVADPAVKL